MQFNVEEIRIMMNTNIVNLQPTALTLSLIAHPELTKSTVALNQYPYFTFDVKYPLITLRSMNIQDRIDFFFNKDTFIERLSAYTTDVLTEPSHTDETQIEEYYNKRDANIDNNIMTMLEILFPTKFPVINDLRESIDAINKSNAFKHHMLINPFLNQPFSYLTINGKKYTIKKVVWLNDILNHPKYRFLLESYRKFKIWYDEELGRVELAMSGGKTKAIEQLDTILTLIKQNIDKTKEIPSTVVNVILLLNYMQILLTTTTSPDVGSTTVATQQLFDKANIKYKTPITIHKTLNEFIEQHKNNDYIGTFIDVIDYLKQLPPDNIRIKSAFPNEMLSNINTLITNFIQKNPYYYPLNRLKRVKQYFETPYNDIISRSRDSEGKTIEIPSEYKNFMVNIIKQYQRPQRETTNRELQNLLNLSESNAISEFFSFMNSIYSRFMRGESIYVNPRLLNVGISYINTSSSDRGQRREIYMMVDLIEGEITDKNVGAIFCPFVGEHLGNEFEFLIRMWKYGKVGDKDISYWDVNRNRMLFSMSKLLSNEAKKMNKKIELVGRPVETRVILPVETRPEESKDTQELNSWFFSEIIKDGDTTMDKLIKDINNTGVLTINEFELFNYIKRVQPRLYDLISKWHKHKYEYSSSLNEGLVRIRSRFSAEIDVLENKLKEQAVQLNPELVNKYKCEILVYKLYKLIVDKLIESESKKTELVQPTSVGRQATTEVGRQATTEVGRQATTQRAPQRTLRPRRSGGSNKKSIVYRNNTRKRR